MWSTRRLNDMDPCPWPATFRELTGRDTCALVTPHRCAQSGPSRSGGLPEAMGFAWWCSLACGWASMAAVLTMFPQAQSGDRCVWPAW